MKKDENIKLPKPKGRPRTERNLVNGVDTVRKARSDARSILNNIAAATEDDELASRAKFYLSGICQITGQTQQTVIARSIIRGISSIPEYACHFPALTMEWENGRRAVEKKPKKTRKTRKTAGAVLSSSQDTDTKK